MTSGPVVAGELLRLRPVRPGDHLVVQAIRADAETQRQSDQELDAPTADDLLAAVGDAESCHYAITLPDDDEMIGEVVLFGLNHDARRARLRLSMLPDYRGRGYGREAIFRILEVAFAPEPLGFELHRVSLVLRAFNTRLRATYEQFGFREEGRLRDHFADGAGFSDGVVLGILADEFDAGVGYFTPAIQHD